MALILAAFIHIYSVFGAFEWIPSTSEPNIEYYYIAQCMAFNLDVGTNACKAIDANAILVTIPAISEVGTYISKTLNVGGTIRWLDGGPDTSNLIHYSTSPASPRVALPDWPGLCLTTVPSQNGNAMDCGWSAPGIHHGAAAICKRSTLNPSTTGPTMLTKEPTSMPTKNPTGIPSVIPSISPTHIPTATPPSNYPTKRPTAQPSSRTWKDCIDETIEFGGGYIQLFIEIDVTNRDMQIQMTAPKHIWFGIGFGANKMN
eukprot:826900_1